MFGLVFEKQSETKYFHRFFSVATTNDDEVLGRALISGSYTF